MKKILIMALFVLCISSAGVWAQEGQSSDQDQNKNNAMPASPRMQPFPPMPAMPGMQPQKIVVATSDGGIVIVQGNNITKFDKNLNITKSVELEENKSQ